MSFRLSHLAVLLAVTTVFTAIGGAVATYGVAYAEFRNVLDDDLENQAKMLARLLAAERVSPSALEELLDKTFKSDEEDTLWVNVYDTRSGDHASNLEHSQSLAKKTNGSLRLELSGHAWHGYQHREGNLVVQLLRRDDLYKEVRAEILEDIVTPAVVASAVNMLLLAALMGLILWPLTRLVRQLEARSADSLAPLELKTPAKEIGVLRDMLNRLFGRVRGALQRERQFASDIAHEMRTPLTTLKLELASGEPDLLALKAEVDRVARLVTQLLTLARLEQGFARQAFSSLSLSGIVGKELERFADKIAGAGMVVHGRLAPATVEGDATLLEILLQNLLNNVLNHCPPGTVIDVQLDKRDGKTMLEVIDTGPGIAEPERAGMTERFTRLDSRGEGLGLGLAICHKIVQAHGATLKFLPRNDGAPGLKVEVVFPA